MTHATGTAGIVWMLLLGLLAAAPAFLFVRRALRGRFGQRVRRRLHLGKWQPRFLKPYEPPHAG